MMNFRNLPYILLLFVSILACDSTTKQKHDEAQIPDNNTPDITRTRKEKKKLNFYFTPSKKTQLLEASVNEVAKAMEKETGMTINAVIPENYSMLIHDFENNKADFAIMNTLGYIVANKKANVHARLKSIKYGKSTYKGQIIANVKSGIEELGDINGKRFIFTNKTSTSGFFYPAMLLKANNVVPATTSFALTHDFVVESVYRGMSDAGATYYSEPSETREIRDARAILKTKYPDIEERVKIIALTESIPNDPVVFNANVEPATVAIVCSALQKYARTEEGRTILTKLYGTEDFIKCSDEDYKGIIAAVGGSKYNLDKLD